MTDRSRPNRFDSDRFHEIRLPKIPTEQIKFSSASEKACALLFQKHCDWSPIVGATYQIPIGRCLFDFRIGSTLIEWHPINLRNEFITPLMRALSPLIDRLPKHKKAGAISAIESEMAAQYIKRRSQVMSAHSFFSSFRLVVCFTPEQFAEVVKSNSPQQLTTEEIVGEFRQFLRPKK